MINIANNKILIPLVVLLSLISIAFSLKNVSKEEILSCNKQKNVCTSTIKNMYNYTKIRTLSPPSKIKGVETVPHRKRHELHYRLQFKGVSCNRIFIYDFLSEKNAQKAANDINTLLNNKNNIIEYKIFGFTNNFDTSEMCYDG